MADTTMLDTSIFGALNREKSGPIIAKDLEDLAGQGEEIMVAASTYQEILNTPDPNLRAAQLKQIKDFKMTVQSPTSMADRVDQGHAIDADLRQQQRGVELKDLPIVADVRIQQRRTPGRTVKLFTVERMSANSIGIGRSYGIRFSIKSRRLGDLGPRKIFSRVAPGGLAPGELTLHGKIGRGLKAGGVAVGVIVVSILLEWLARKLYEKFVREGVDRQFEKMRPEILAAIRAKKEDALRLLASGNNHAFATVRLSMIVDHFMYAGRLQMSTFPVLEYLGLQITPTDESEEGKVPRVEGHIGGRTETTFYKVSFELSFPADEVAIYKSYIAQMKWFDEQMAIAPSDEDKKRLAQDRENLMREMRAVLTD
jgi:hypothetical protein